MPHHPRPLHGVAKDSLPNTSREYPLSRGLTSTIPSAISYSPHAYTMEGGDAEEIER